MEERFLTFVYDVRRDADGRIVGLLCEGMDATEAYHAQEAVRESELRFRTALAIETVGAMQFNMDGVLVDANDAFFA